MAKRRRFLRYALMLLLIGMVGMVGMTRPVEANSQESMLLLKIHSTRIITAHLSLGYDRGSLYALSRRLSPADVPSLLTLYFHKEDRLGVKLALVSQCKTSLDALIRLMDDTGHETSAYPTIEFSDLYEFREIASDIANYDHCDPETRARSKQFVERLVARSATESAKIAERAKQARESDEQARAQGLQQLKSYVNGTLTPLPRPGKKQPDQ